jgi:isopentenyl diphosphate isomerase/L-lactate dehydrogenase-like FMN-dependent dehydrogenase
MDFLNVHELEKLASEKLPAIAYDYYRSGAWDEQTLRANTSEYEKIKISYRVLRDVSERDLSTRLFERKIPFPMVIAPTAFHKLAHEDGELATARAAKNTGLTMTISSLATCRLEEIAEAAGSEFWFQLYVNKDREFTKQMVQRAEAAGCKALVVTVDTPVWGVRERDVRNGFHLPAGLSAVNLDKVNSNGQMGNAGNGMGDAFGWMLDAALTWKDIDWLCSITSMPVLLKGICRADDALLAMEHGAGGIIISNHGGRQLDGAPSTIEVLPLLAEVVNKKLPLMIDGGIRRGTDLLKAIALGADAVLVGRPVIWGLAAGGQEGVEKILGILKHEFDLAMALAGCKAISEITADLVFHSKR